MKHIVPAGIILLICCGIAVSCKEVSRPSTPARNYFVQAFDSIKKYSLRRNEVNIDSVENHYLLQIHDTMSFKYAYHFLREAVMAIDRHSDFYRPTLVRQKGLILDLTDLSPGSYIIEFMANSTTIREIITLSK